MAIYTGFFDAAFDEATGTYDREYGSADFTGYFGQIVGSGVCVHGNDDSMRVYYDAASKRAVVNPGYLFIRGYWLKNDGLYTVDLADLPAGVYAIRAALNLGTRSITIGQVPKATPEEYPDALVLAYATVAEGGVTVEDTRGRTDICGLIDAAGSLSVKVDYAIHYIDNEINGKLDQIQQNLQAQEAEIDGKIAEANGLIAKIAPPAVGTIKFSASQDIEEGWLRCDGKFINEADYPELVAALGKNYPSGDKFQVLSRGEVGTSPTNMVVYGGKVWTYSHVSRTLYGVDPEGGAITSVSVSSKDPLWNNLLPNTPAVPIVLSIVPHKVGEGAKLFLCQVIADASFQNKEGDKKADLTSGVLVFGADFTGEEISLDVSLELKTVSTIEYFSDFNSRNEYESLITNRHCIPCVISRMEKDKEIYFCIVGNSRSTLSSNYDFNYVDPIVWTDDSDEAFFYSSHSSNPMNNVPYSDKTVNNFGNDKLGSQRVGYNFVNKNEVVSINGNGIQSAPLGTYDFELSASLRIPSASPGAMSIVGQTGAAFFPKISDGVYTIDKVHSKAEKLTIPIQFPSGARTFLDAGCYLWGKDMYFFFVGTGILFFRKYDAKDMGYLDTTKVLGEITQFGCLRYSQDEGTLYIMGQDTRNQVVVAKIVLNTLYDYASDGAWLPLIASDGIPAYIKAIGEPPPPPPPSPTSFKILKSLEKTDPGLPGLLSVFDVNLNGEPVKYGSNVEYPSTPIPMELVARQNYTNPLNNEIDFNVRFDNIHDQEFLTRLGGTVLPVGGSVKKGDMITFMVNMKGLKETHKNPVEEYAFRFTSTNTAGKGG